MTAPASRGRVGQFRYLDVCSGISAKACAKCGVSKPLVDFHRQPSGPLGRHSWCKTCANTAQRATRVRRDTTERRRERLLRQRYGISSADKAAMLAAQGGVCRICEREPKRPVVDHCHSSGAVRGVLCHKCNIALHAIEDAAFLAAALTYLGKVQ